MTTRIGVKVSRELYEKLQAAKQTRKTSIMGLYMQAKPGWLELPRSFAGTVYRGDGEPLYAALNAPESERAWLQRMADSHGVTMSSVVRSILLHAVRDVEAQAA